MARIPNAIYNAYKSFYLTGSEDQRKMFLKMLDGSGVSLAELERKSSGRLGARAGLERLHAAPKNVRRAVEAAVAALSPPVREYLVTNNLRVVLDPESGPALLTSPRIALAAARAARGGTNSKKQPLVQEDDEAVENEADEEELLEVDEEDVEDNVEDDEA